jgi:hypothetical protein
MGNTFPPTSLFRSIATSSTTSEHQRKTSLITGCLTSNHRRYPHTTKENSTRQTCPIFARPRSLAPTDAEIIDIHALRHDDEHRLIQQLDYIHSCVRKDKGLFGKLSTCSMFIIS